LETKPKYTLFPSKNFDYYLCVLSGIASLIGSYFAFLNAFEKINLQIIDILFSVLLVILGVWCLYYYLSRKIIYVFEDSFVFKYGLAPKKVKLHKDDVQAWAEIHKISKYNNWDELFVFTTFGKYRFASYNYDGYGILKAQITKNKTRNLDYEKKWDSKSVRNFSFFFLFFGLAFLLSGLNYLVIKSKPITSNELVKITQIVTSEIKIKKEGRRSRYFELRFNDYPEFMFNVKGYGYSATYSDEFVNDITLGDTLTVSIKKEDFEKKIAKTKPPTFWDKTINYYDIPVFGIAYKDKEYLNLNDYNKRKKSSRKSSGWWLLGISVFLLAIGLFIYIKKKEIAEA
jgi:hypothetical protein